MVSRTRDDEGPPVELRGPLAWCNWRAARGGVPAHGTREFGLYTDAHLTDVVRDGLGPYKLLNTVPVNSEALRFSLVVRADDHLSDEMHDIPEEGWEKGDVTLDVGGFHDDEIAALLSIHYGIRLRSGGQIRDFGHYTQDPLGSPQQHGFRTPQLPYAAFDTTMLPGTAFSGGRRKSVKLSDPEFVQRLARYPNLSLNAAVAFQRSARNYQSALWNADADAELAWLRLVSAIETAANHWRKNAKPPKDALEEQHADLVKTIREVASEDVLEAIAPMLRDLAKSTWKFLEFFREFAPDPPSERPDPGVARVDWSKLRDALLEIYKWRSVNLHEGIPFPQPLCTPPQSVADPGKSAAERPLGLGSFSRGVVWPAHRLPMYLHIFAHACRSSLLKWWDSLPASG